MHASSQHNKAEFMIARAKEFLADTEVFLKKSEEDYDAIQARTASQEQENLETHKKLDDEIRVELSKMTNAADEYFGSFKDPDSV